jgi:hypothetical protein
VWYVVVGVAGVLIGALATDLIMVRTLARRMLLESVAGGEVESVSEALQRGNVGVERMDVSHGLRVP